MKCQIIVYFTPLLNLFCVYYQIETVEKPSLSSNHRIRLDVIKMSTILRHQQVVRSLLATVNFYRYHNTDHNFTQTRN
jgi:hypothetical protein